MLNRIVIMGRLVRDPELKSTPSGISVCTITLACERTFSKQGEKRETDFFDCVIWRGTAEFVSRYFRKGQLAAVEGRMQSRKWTDKEGRNRITYEIAAEQVYFCEKPDRFDQVVNAAESAGVPVYKPGEIGKAAAPKEGWPVYNEPGQPDVWPDDDEEPF